jgi:hypothetical protein
MNALSLTDRRAHQCRHDGCDSEAAWHLHLGLQCVGIGKDRIQLQCESTLKVCNRHTKAAMELVMSDWNKVQIAAALISGGFPPPDFSSATAIFVPISHSAIEPAQSDGI